MEYLSQGLKYAKSLSTLVMNHCILRPAVETLDAFSEGIYASNSLKSLSFCYNFPTLLNQEFWLSNIARSRLVDLNLSGNNLGSVLSSFTLKDNNTLRQLILSNCKISSEGLYMLSNTLLENTSLESLDLSRNPLCVGSDEGVKA
jgi:Ran GTPase-activating protein (RanGAP) involved in mRNA processing and transport